VKVPFNLPTLVGNETSYIEDAINRRGLSGDKYYTKKCHELIEKQYQTQKALLTTSCTHALEASAILSDICPGDEVIMPSYTFVSTANAFALRGAKIVFVDIRPDTQNMDEKLIEQAITKKTKAIVPVHYAGVSCEMDRILSIAEKYKLIVIEDAAQGVHAYYKGQALGTMGDFGCYSFHETKNYTMGEGGALLIRGVENIQRAEIVREKGTNRTQFLQGTIDKYSWVSLGSSYLPSELNAAYLYPQLKEAGRINEKRKKSWNRYQGLLKPLEESGKIKLPYVPETCEHNAHMFYIKTRDGKEREILRNYLLEQEVIALAHYVPLHTSLQGKKCGTFCGTDHFTSETADTILRLPLYTDITEEQIEYVCDCIMRFYKGR